MYGATLNSGQTVTPFTLTEAEGVPDDILHPLPLFPDTMNVLGTRVCSTQIQELFLSFFHHEPSFYHFNCAGLKNSFSYYNCLSSEEPTVLLIVTKTQMVFLFYAQIGFCISFQPCKCLKISIYWVKLFFFNHQKVQDMRMI